MQNQLTVRQLIDILQRVDQDLPVEISLGMEYQEPVTEDMVEVSVYDGRQYLHITDTPGM